MNITGFEDIISLDEFYYCLEVGEHELCQFRISIREKNFAAYMERLEKECTVEDDAFKFSGKISAISADKGIDCCYISVTVLGKTAGYDREVKYRVFQSEDKKVPDILDKMGMSEISYSAVDNNVIPYIIVQKNETDWAFLNRLADHLGKALFPGKKMWFGDAADGAEEIAEDDIIEMHVTLNCGKSEIACRLKKTLFFGSKVALYGKEFYVDAVIYKKLDEIYVYEYHLKENIKDDAYRELPINYFTAKVQDNNDPEKLGRVRLEFLEPYEDCMKDEAVWVECSSSWATRGWGIACVPFIGDIVHVMIADRSIVVCSVKRTEAFDGRFDDPNTRYVFVGENTYLAINDECISISTASDKASLRIKDSMITIATDKTAVEFSDAAKIATDCFEVDGKNKIAVTASKIDIKGKNGVSIN